MKMDQLALLNRVPFRKFIRARAFPVPRFESSFSGTGLAREQQQNEIPSLHFEAP